MAAQGSGLPLEPETPDERSGTDPNVVFPTAICTIGTTPYVFDGMADSAIGVAKFHCGD